MSVDEISPDLNIQGDNLIDFTEPKTTERSEVGTGDLGNSLSTYRADETNRRMARFDRRAMSARILTAEHLQTTGKRLVSLTEAVDLQTGEITTLDREEARKLLPPRPARCSWPIGQVVTLHGSSESRAHYSGTERCGSISACPVCAPVIRAERAREIACAVTAHQKNGGSLVFVTLTIRHKQEHPLKDSIDAVLRGWQSTIRGTSWDKFKERHQISGYIRSLEITRSSQGAGWHPHLHAIFFMESLPTQDSLAEFEDFLFDRWSRTISRFKEDFTPVREHGIDCQLVDQKGAVLASYVSKLQEEKTSAWGVEAEMTRGDLKNGRKSSLIPFQLLDTGQTNLWIEYVHATKGRRIITWSKGLKERYEVEERDDEEILDDAEKSPLAWVTSRYAYESTRKESPVLLAVALDAVETENWPLLQQLLPGQRSPGHSTLHE